MAWSLAVRLILACLLLSNALSRLWLSPRMLIRGGARDSDQLTLRLRALDGSVAKITLSKHASLSDLHYVIESKLAAGSVPLEAVQVAVNQDTRRLADLADSSTLLADLSLDDGDWITLSMLPDWQAPSSLETCAIPPTRSQSPLPPQPPQPPQRSKRPSKAHSTASNTIISLRRQQYDGLTTVIISPALQGSLLSVASAQQAQQPTALLLGQVNQYAGKTRIHAISMLQVSGQELVDALPMLGVLGLQVVGICAPTPNTSTGSSISSRDTWDQRILLSTLQLHPHTSQPIAITVHFENTSSSQRKSKSTDGRHHHTLALADEERMSVEATAVSQQGLQLFKSGLLLPSANTSMVAVQGGVLMHGQEVHEVDVHIFAVPLSVVVSALRHQPSATQGPSRGPVVYLPNIAHDFPSPAALAAQPALTVSVRRYLVKLLRMVTLPGPLPEEPLSRLRDVHLLLYLRRYMSPSVFQALCEAIAVTNTREACVLPEEVKMELDLIREGLIEN